MLKHHQAACPRALTHRRAGGAAGVEAVPLLTAGAHCFVGVAKHAVFLRALSAGAIYEAEADVAARAGAAAVGAGLAVGAAQLARSAGVHIAFKLAGVQLALRQAGTARRLQLLLWAAAGGAQSEVAEALTVRHRVAFCGSQLEHMSSGSSVPGATHCMHTPPCST